MTLKEENLIPRLRAQLMNCAGWESDQVSADRKRALDYYFQRPRGDEVRGRSNVVAGDLSAMVEANLAQMMDAFSSEHIAEFDALGPEDDDQAALESATVVQAVMKDNPGYIELGSAIKDALLLRNGFVKCWSDESTASKTVNLKNATAEAIAEIGAPPGVEVEIKKFDQEARTATIRVTTTIKKFRCEAIPGGNILYPKNWHKTDLQEIPFFAERHVESRAEMIRRGFPKRKVNQLKAYTGEFKIDEVARSVRQDYGTTEGVDKSQDLIEWFECYVLLDDGDSGSERRRIALAGITANSLLENEPASLVSYATGSAFINPHRLTGISLFDKLRQTQDLNTGLERALMDNVNTVIKNRLAYLDGKVNVDDLSDGRPNGNIRVRASVGNVNNAITNFQQADLSQGLLSNLEYQRQKRTELGGASLELASGNMQMAGGRVGSEGVDRAFSVMEQLAAHMTKNMAQSLIRNVFLLAHAVLRENFDMPVNVKRGGRWQSPVPSEWQARTRVTVKIGMSPGERARKVSALGKVVDSQLQLAERDMDGVLVNIEGFYKALTDWARAAELPNPEQYFIDPSTDESKQALQAKEEAAAKSQQANQSLMQHAVGLEQLKIGFEKYKTDQQKQFDYWKEVLEAQIEEAKIVGKATVELMKTTGSGSDEVNGSGRTEPNSVRESGADGGQ